MSGAESPAVVAARDVAFAYAAPRARRPTTFRMTALSFAIAPAEVLGVIGPNSAGKTTLIRLLTAIVKPTAGEILLAGRPLGSFTAWQLAREIAVVSQELPQGLPFTVEQFVLTGRYAHAPDRFFESREDLAIAHEAMRATGVETLAVASVEMLSGGERQRAVLARALAQRPRLLVLDEPTAHLDLRHQVETAALLTRLNREQGLAVLLVSHDITMAAAIADRLLLLAEGRVVCVGTPEQVLDAALLSSVFGCRVVVDKHPTTSQLSVQIEWSTTGGR